MQKAASILYWFCAATAVELILFGAWNALTAKTERLPILVFCLLMAAVFYLAGVYARHMAKRAANQN